MESLELWELIAIHLSTLLLILTSSIFLVKLSPLKSVGVFRYLFCFVSSVTALYILVFLLRFPTPDLNVVEYTRMLFPFMVFFMEGVVPLFGSFFGLETVGIKHKRWVEAIVLAVVLIYLVLLFLIPPEFDGREWVLSGNAARYFYVVIFLMFLPVILFLYNAIKSNPGTDRRIAIIIFASFLMYTVFGSFFDPLGIGPFAVRRLLVAVSLVFLYIGYMTPSWANKLLKI